VKEQQFKWVVVIIISAFCLTLGSQLLWTYQNYQENQRLLFREVQGLLDESVQDYFVDFSKNKTGLSDWSDDKRDSVRFIFGRTVDSLSRLRRSDQDSLKIITIGGDKTQNPDFHAFSMRKEKDSNSTPFQVDIKNLTTSIFISLRSDTK
jgi:hypothetical protein